MSEQEQLKSNTTNNNNNNIEQINIIPPPSDQQEPIKRTFIDLKRIEDDSHPGQAVIQIPQQVQGQPSIQFLDEQQQQQSQNNLNNNNTNNDQTGQNVSQQSQDNTTMNQNKQQQGVNINFTSASQFSPTRKGERNSLSPKRRQQQQSNGNNTPCLSPLPDLKVQRSKFDISQTQFFITNINAFRGLESFPKINELYTQISNVIEDLEGKVDTVVERHEAEFLFAYRNHMAKIKTEMIDMKKQAEEQEKRLNDNDRVSGLERQIVWLRDECLKLYKILGKKNDDLANKDRIIRDLTKDNTHLQNQIKELMRKNKLMSMKTTNNNTQNIITMNNTQNISNTQQSILAINDQLLNIQITQSSPKSQQQLTSHQDNNINLTQQNQQQQQLIISQEDEQQLYLTQQNNQNNQLSPQSNITSKRASINPQIIQQLSNTQQLEKTNNNTNNQQIIQMPFDQIINKKQIQTIEEMSPEFGQKIINLVKKNIEGELSVSGLIHEIAYLIKYINDRKQKQYKLLQDKLQTTLKHKLQMGLARSDLEAFFFECVETARKQIIKRKYATGNNNNNGNGNANGNNQNNGSQMNQNSIFKSPQPNNNMSDFIDSIKDYKIFRNEDKVKILELLLSHEKLLMFLYQKIFPTNFNMHLQNALDTQDDIPLYLRSFPQHANPNNSNNGNASSNNKYINISDNSQQTNKQKKENYLDLLSEQDEGISQENSNNNQSNQKQSQLQEQSTRLPQISENSSSYQQINHLYISKPRNTKRNSLDQRNIFDQSSQQQSSHNSSLIDSNNNNGLLNSNNKYQIQTNKLGSLSNKFSQQRNTSLRTSNRNQYDIISQQQSNSEYKNKSASKQSNNNNNSFEQSFSTYNTPSSELYSLKAYSEKKNHISQKNNSNSNNNNNNIKINNKQQQQSIIQQQMSPPSHSNSSDSSHLISDKLNIVNGKLVFKNI